MDMNCICFGFHSRKEIETREFFSDAELQEALAKEMSKEERKHEQEVKEYQEKIDLLNQQYLDLENEFRIALTVEARRFKDVRIDTIALLIRVPHFRILPLFR